MTDAQACHQATQEAALIDKQSLTAEGWANLCEAQFEWWTLQLDIIEGYVEPEVGGKDDD